MKDVPQTAEALIPEGADLGRLREIAADCRACHLHERATQTVFGAGPSDARVVFIGEQPGDEEDREGEPFVGPAGRELDRALEAADIDRGQVYITNLVKHFKWKKKGRKRLHQTPNREEIGACEPWLMAELERIRPSVTVCLGATAAKGLLGAAFRVTRQRGELHPGPFDTTLTATVHPSSILRSPSDEERHRARDEFTEDLRRIAAVIRDGPAAGLRYSTKDALYERAQALDLPGRSTMTKGELAGAIVSHLWGGD